ncbi:putative actin-related protein 2 [Capsicum annuum]|uniref:Uncharacterized protein n=1 Tax=Capsicum annuum TaxID=4072 RepID=A0A1U8FZD8_CAPAN|nr:uncharacterized protein LOC107860788 [Capsicum annuum]XP_016561749.1 uncharacterized protein LOC107860788 [Capsicum annuum]XP_016561750.1 uncharacterized protein LOC107860788 [Capsicum annuum]KAF3618537.1 putative actin-related protein 2 [Capsicum annuum]KAF3619165.1 putative actin-related protein 2 [Capsicum annuum]PHT92072.1 hypothetical protein T459_07185 [Capsicum annuum]
MTTTTAATHVLLVVSCCFLWLSLSAAAKVSNSHITVMGMVYCDICSNNSFSRHSYFMPGVEVKIDCTFKAMSTRTAELVSVSVNRTTNRYGVYRLEIPSVDGIECAAEKAVGNSCRASLIGSSSSSCNVPGSTRTTTDEITIKAKQANTCIYSLTALNFRPTKKNVALCGN